MFRIFEIISRVFQAESERCSLCSRKTITTRFRVPPRWQSHMPKPWLKLLLFFLLHLTFLYPSVLIEGCFLFHHVVALCLMISPLPSWIFMCAAGGLSVSRAAGGSRVAVNPLRLCSRSLLLIVYKETHAGDSCLWCAVRKTIFFSMQTIFCLPMRPVPLGPPGLFSVLSF